MNYLVLGSAGQIGAHLVSYLKDKGETCLEVDIVNDPEEQDLRYPSVDIAQKFYDADFVFFLAFDVGGSTYLKKYQSSFSFVDNNVKIMDNTFDLLAYTKKPFIFASSQMSNLLASTYGNLKMVGERYTNSINGMVCKFWNVYGEERDPAKFHVVTDFILKGLNNKTIDMKTDGKESRQFLHAEDCSEALYTLSQLYNHLDRSISYDVTSFEWTKIIDLAYMIAEKTDATVIESTEKDQVQMQRLEQPTTEILKYWKPTTYLDAGISELVEFYKGYKHEGVRI